VEAEVGASGVKKVVERELSPTELTALQEAADAVKAKAADVVNL